MDETALLQKAAQHAQQLIAAEPMLASLAATILQEKAAQAHLSRQNASLYTADQAGMALAQHYIEKLAADQRIRDPSWHERCQCDEAFTNLLSITGLAEAECHFLIQRQVERWENEIE
ncbi:MAG: hypothetical protein V1746_00850 [bacterium]